MTKILYTNYIYVPYSQYNNPNYRFQFLLSNKEENRQSGNYEVDEEGYLTDVKQCYIDLNTDVKGIIKQNEIEKNYPLFLISIVSDKNALTYSVLQSSSCERLVLPQQTQRDKILGSIVKLYKYTVPASQLSEMKNFGIYKNEKGEIIGNNTTYYGIEEIQCNSFNSVQNLLGFSSNWTDANDIKDGWEPTTWTDLRVYGPKRVAAEGGAVMLSDLLYGHFIYHEITVYLVGQCGYLGVTAALGGRIEHPFHVDIKPAPDVIVAGCMLILQFSQTIKKNVLYAADQQAQK